ncbi:MAG TPA: GPP34 family phosphoprotein [Bacteroidales bacterium]|nr:GPP34 family phosphoprotein [Bacteroidales bacterium]HRZ20901.1 GPP34 family phosphoprotein [Bacteroidales bacterium]
MELLLSIPEEIYLLPIHKRGGQKIDFKHKKFEITLAASILMDLALRHRIDTDMEHIIPEQETPTGDELLDEVLDWIFHAPRQETITYWIRRITERAEHIRKSVLEGLLHKKILKVSKQHIFLGYASKKYPVADDREIREIKSRVRDLVLGNELPELRDMVIISLAYYGDLLSFIFSEEEIILRKHRIEHLAKMDLIGQAITRSVKELTFSVVASMRTKDLLGIKTPVEKLDELVEEMKALMQIEQDTDLPEWLRKGTDQYLKTLAYIEETGTNEIVFNTKTGKYGLKLWAFPGGI